MGENEVTDEDVSKHLTDTDETQVDSDRQSQKGRN